MADREHRATAQRLAAALGHDLPQDGLERLAAAGHVVTLPAGWTFIHENTPGDSCYVVLAGEVAVVRDHREVLRLGVGSIVGEAALAKRSLRTASVCTRTPVEMFDVGYERLEELFARTPTLRERLLHPVEAPAS